MKELILIKNALSLEMSQLEEESLKAYAFQLRCTEVSLLEEIIYITLKNIKDLKKDTKMYQFILVHVFQQKKETSLLQDNADHYLKQSDLMC